MSIDIISLSSKGQLAIPADMRKTANLKSGDRFFIYQDGDSFVLKRIRVPSVEDFEKDLEESQAWAKEVGMKESDIYDAIREVRAEKHADCH